MKYEDFIKNPYGELRHRLAQLGYRNPALDLLQGENIVLRPTHGIGGNPDRFVISPLRIEDRGDWRTRMPVTTQVFTGILAAPLMARYGYKIF
jgi:hypothetical protein